MTDYLDFVEEYKEETSVNLFEKVKIIASRTRDIYEGKSSKAISEHALDRHKPTTIAHFELINGYIEPNIHAKEDKAEDFLSDIDIE